MSHEIPADVVPSLSAYLARLAARPAVRRAKDRIAAAKASLAMTSDG